MSLNIDDIDNMMSTHGIVMYGSEAISQLDHALQTAYLVEQTGGTPELVVAALLHDLGHLIRIEQSQNNDYYNHQDDLHEMIVLPFLRYTFGDAVLEPIRLHVQAKKYLCLTEPNYWASLSKASQQSLMLQGGFFNPDQGQVFINQPYASDAVTLRRCDDLAKNPSAITPNWSYFSKIMREVVVSL
jgi:phosphonate degradation associated HDIG domain protein